MLLSTSDTIAAIATPMGVAALAVVRISGSDALLLADGIFRSVSGKKLCEQPGYTALLGHIWDKGSPLDEVIATVYRAPKSYTGENCVEFSSHGGLYLVQELLRVCVEAGARPAGPGEFTRRAFLNGKMNLTQAEAVADLIASSSEAARRAALSARHGTLSRGIGRLVENLSAQSAHLAAWSDYPEEDLEPVDTANLLQAISHCIDDMDKLLDSYQQGRLIYDGVETAIVGKPNVGKSTLMNLLSGSKRSIVTDIPGTTRDIVQHMIQLGDFRLKLLDTAGIRETDNPVEQMGVELAKSQLSSAQLILAVFDSSNNLDDEDRTLLKELQGKPCIAVINKTDLERKLHEDAIKSNIEQVVYLSAETGEGRASLETAIVSLLSLDKIDLSAPILQNQRQRYCVFKARNALNEAVLAVKAGYTLDAASVCIDTALEMLLQLTGERATEKVLEQVFSRFCVGK